MKSLTKVLTKRVYFMAVFTLVALAGFLVGSYTQAGSIGDIQLRFCEEAESTSGEITYFKHLALDLDQNEEKDLCMQITNLSDEDMSIKLNFVDGTVTNDSDHKKACKDEGKNAMFGKFVTMENSTIHLTAGESIEKHALLEFDSSVGGQILGCVTYYQAGALDTKGNEMIKILVRKANFIDVNLSGDISAGLLWLSGANEINNISNNDRIQITKTEGLGNYQTILSLKNIGSVQQNIVISGVVHNLFSKNIASFSDKLVLPAGETAVITKEILGLPWYSAFVRVNVEVEHNAVSLSNIDDVELYTLVDETRFIMFTVWAIIVCVLFLVLILAIIIMMLHHKHHKKNNKKRNYHHSHKAKAPVKKSAKKLAKPPIKKVAKKSVKKKSK